MRVRGYTKRVTGVKQRRITDASVQERKKNRKKETRMKHVIGYYVARAKAGYKDQDAGHRGCKNERENEGDIQGRRI